MGLFDTLLKQLIQAEPAAFVAWLLNRQVVSIEPVSTELLPEPVRADSVFRITDPDGKRGIVHVEFQGRHGEPPFAARMLEYAARLAVRERTPIQSVVVYHSPGAGAQDSGLHHHPGLDGQPTLIWRYLVLHLWQVASDDLLALGRPGMVPLLGLTRISEPARTLERAVRVIHAEPDRERQLRWLRILIDLLPTEEMMTMARNVLSPEDIEDLQRFPGLWGPYVAARDEGAREQLRANILETIVARFDPPTSEYLRLERALGAIHENERLDGLFRLALRAPTLSEVAREIEPIAE